MGSLNVDINQIKSEEDAIDQLSALNHITLQLLKDRAQDCKRLWIALIISILVNLVLVGAFLWYESQWEYTTTETTTTTQEVEGDGAGINNISGDWYSDNSTHNEGVDE